MNLFTQGITEELACAKTYFSKLQVQNDDVDDVILTAAPK